MGEGFEGMDGVYFGLLFVLFIFMTYGGLKDVSASVERKSKTFGTWWFNIPLTIRKIIIYGVGFPGYIAILFWLFVVQG